MGATDATGPPPLADGGRRMSAAGVNARRFVIACGGTGGHLSPGIALAEALLARGHGVTLFISQKK